MASAAGFRCVSFPLSSSSTPSSKRSGTRASLVSSSSLSSPWKLLTCKVAIFGYPRWHNCVPRASQGEVPTELAEDAKFVPLDADDSIYGPPALLLVGFEADEMEKIQNFLKDLDGDFLKVIYCTENMIKQSVWDAMHTEQTDLEAIEIARSLPRVCIMSGLSGEEMIMFIDAFPETGLRPAVFAALVPNSADKILGDVIEEIMGDHEMLVNNNRIRLLVKKR